jgi:hypothetical protein
MLTMKVKALLLAFGAVAATTTVILVAHKKAKPSGGGGGKTPSAIADELDQAFNGEVFTDQGVKNIDGQEVIEPREDDPDWAVARVVASDGSGYSVPVDENGVAKGYVDDKHHSSEQKTPIASSDDDDGGFFDFG